MKSISILLPIHNEEMSIRPLIEAWSEFLSQKNISHEFLMCEDGSTDNTKIIIEELAVKYPIINLSTNQRRGYGGAVIAGIKAANLDYILCIDSDGQCMPDSFMHLYELLDSCDIAIGYRNPRKDPQIRIIYSYLFRIYFSLFFGNTILDPSCPYVIGRTDIYKKLLPNLSYMREGFWWGFVGAAQKEKLRINQAPIVHYPRIDGSSVVYKPSKMPSIIVRNMLGLIRLKLA